MEKSNKHVKDEIERTVKELIALKDQQKGGQ